MYKLTGGGMIFGTLLSSRSFPTEQSLSLSHPSALTDLWRGTVFFLYHSISGKGEMKGSIRHLSSSLLEHDTGWMGFFMLLPKFKIHSTVPKQVTVKSSFCLHLAQQKRKKNIVQENRWTLKKSQMQRTNAVVCDRKYYPCKDIEPSLCLLVPLFQETWHLPAGDCHYSFCHYIFSLPFMSYKFKYRNHLFASCLYDFS